MMAKRIADYFVIAGVSPNAEFNTESKQILSPILPITDITVIFKGLGETVPNGYECLETTVTGLPADLNHGNLRSSGIFICYRRGNDKPPLVDIGVLHEGRERLKRDSEVVTHTPYGHCASTSNSSKNGTYLTYRRAKTLNSCNQLVVVDLCVIFNNKNEAPPHAFFAIRSNLNPSIYGMIGSEVFLCYKKSLVRPPSLCYTPQILSRFPLQDYAQFALPDSVPLFCLPTGATIELWPPGTEQPKPIFSTFVLTSGLAQKVYGSSISFYERYDELHLSQDQKQRLGLTNDQVAAHRIYAIKSCCMLSRWPFFESFERFLLFLHRLVFYPPERASLNLASISSESRQASPQPQQQSQPLVPLEHYISYFILDVPFPTSQRPKVQVQLTNDESVVISQPFDSLPLPLTGASFVQLLRTVGSENCLNLLLFGLSEQKILLHSLRPHVLTGAAEAITAMLFPFHWQCPYVPLCPLSLCGVLNAPLPFIVGVDSRCFELNSPPPDVICVDLDTKHILLSEYKKCLNLKLLPKRAARALRASLERIQQRLSKLPMCYPTSLNGHSPIHIGSPSANDHGRIQYERQLELEIREAFVRFMATILRDFRSYLLPITKAPTIGTTDPSSLFNLEGFLRSRDRNYNQFYQLITKTQMFTHYIEERSFVSDKDTSLAFFDDCEEKLAGSDNIFSDRPIRLFDTDELLSQADRYIFIPPPERSPGPTSVQDELDAISDPEIPQAVKFGPLDTSLFHRHPNLADYDDLPNLFGAETFKNPAFHSSRSDINAVTTDIINAFEGTDIGSLARQTKQEIRAAQKRARKHAKSPILWPKYLFSCCHSLWFSHLPAFIAYHRSLKGQDVDRELDEKVTSEILRYAHDVLLKIQNLQLEVVEEICYRVLILLCGLNGQPALAVRVLCEMRKTGIVPNAVTYGYYNKAVLESRWPDPGNNQTTIMWNKVRNVIMAIAQFRNHGRLRRERRMPKIPTEDGVPRRTKSQSQDPLLASLYRLPESQSSYRHTTMPLNPLASSVDSGADQEYRRMRSTIHHSFSSVGGHPGKMTMNDDDIFDVPPPMMHKSFSMQIKALSDTKQPVMDRHDEDKLAGNYFREVEPIQVEDEEKLEHKLSTANFIFRETDWDRTRLANDISSEAGILFPGGDLTFALRASDLDESSNQTDNLDSNRGSCTNEMNNQTMLLMDGLAPSPKNTVIPDLQSCLKTKSFANDTQILLKLQKDETITSTNLPGRKTQGKAELDSDSELESDSGADSQDMDPQASTSTLNVEKVPENDENEPFIGTRTPPRRPGRTSTKGPPLGDALALTSTPNFKLSSLIHQNSLNWPSKWTPSQKSTQSVYKNIKDAATGIVTSFNELKSSFSVSTSNTPSKLLGSAQNRSTVTKEMLTKCANYFTDMAGFLPQRYDHDEDDASVSSDHMARLCIGLDDEDSRYNNEGNTCTREEMFDMFQKSYKTDSAEFMSRLHDLIMGPRGDQKIVMLIELVTCCRCKICKSILYDEEIMDRWSSNDSNLNTKCAYCHATIVPIMTISITDHRFDYESTNECNLVQADDHDLNKRSLLESATKADLVVNLDNSCSSRHVSKQKQSFTVPYLSPLVLRKEVGNVLESTGDACLANSSFVDEHPIIYWNLLWFFCRVNLPTHLAELCLNAETVLNGRKIPDRWTSEGSVSVQCLWDNEKLHGNMGRPLYQLWQRDPPSTNVDAILGDQLRFSKPLLEKAICAVKANNMIAALNMLLNERLKSRLNLIADSNHHNLYREVLLLIQVAHGKEILNPVCLEKEYKRAFEALNHKQVALNRFDQPPTLGDVCCRKFFRPLELMTKN